MSFLAIEHRGHNPDQKNRSRDEIEEVFTNGFAWEIREGRTHPKEPPEKEKEWKRHRDGNVESSNPPPQSNAKEVAISARSAKVQMDVAREGWKKLVVTTASATDVMKGNPWR